MVYYKSKDTYDGQWRRNRFHGVGTYYWGNNTKYEVQYKHARRVVVFDFVKAVWPQFLRRAAGARGAGLHHLREDLLLEFPHFLMFPMAPTAPRPGTCGGDALPAFRAVPAKGRPGPRGAGAPFLTHTKHRPAFDCCPAGLAGATDCVDVALPDADAGGDNVPHR